MDLNATIRSLIHDRGGLNKTPISFRTGQIFYGRVGRIYPNQLAEIRFGTHPLIAKIEVPLTSGEGHWLQVASDKGEIQLKLLEAPRDPSRAIGGEVASLLKHLGLSSDQTHQALAKFLMRHQLPISKEEIIQAGQWLKQSDMEKGLETIKLMRDKGMPFTEQIYKSLLAAGKSESVNELIQTLARQLSGAGNPSAVSKEIIEFLGKWDSENNSQSGRLLLGQIIRVAIDNNNQVHQLIAKAILHKLGISSLAKPVETVVIQEAIGKLATLGQGMGLAGAGVEAPDGHLARTLTVSESEMLSKLAEAAKKELTGEQALLQMKRALDRTGIFYENNLLHSEKANKIFEDSLKPLLIKYLQEASLLQTPASRVIAEQLLLRMNGQQLLSIENGPMQHVFYETPIQLFGYQSELAVHWSGKRMENGKIDPDFCRVIFYLALEQLKETIVDMQIQKRVVTINIINDSKEIKQLAEPILPSLESGLQKMNYILSAVHFKQPGNVQQQGKKQFNTVQNSTYQGVDIRI